MISVFTDRRLRSCGGPKNKRSHVANEGWETDKLAWVDEIMTGDEVRESVRGEGWVELELQIGQCGFFFPLRTMVNRQQGWLHENSLGCFSLHKWPPCRCSLWEHDSGYEAVAKAQVKGHTGTMVTWMIGRCTHIHSISEGGKYTSQS